MIRELRLLVFTIAVYFFLGYFGMFKTIDEVMKSQDELMILSVKVVSMLFSVYVLNHFSKTWVIEGVENKKDVYLELERVVGQKKWKNLIDLVEENTDRIYEDLSYGSLVECNAKMNIENDDILGVVRCIKKRLVDNVSCGIGQQSGTNECMINHIMDSIHVLDPGSRKEAFHEIKKESENTPVLTKKLKLSNALDNLIISIQKDKNHHNWIEYILELYKDVLLGDEIKYLESRLKK